MSIQNNQAIPENDARLKNKRVPKKRNHCDTKSGRILRLMLDRGPIGLDSQEARLKHGDGCLHSTVSGWQSNHGLEVARTTITVSGWGGAPTRVCRYWLDDKAAERARKLIEAGECNE